ncbi:hypothetical protein DCAR_0102033 [Daucus carota subsp. sativus]|uniref:K Homology domain-containing protein n=1 Tax=Daucus carota subsp. sativus TaxID=79200 RepID=A0A166GTR2_DAUCS|nr:PREDICTED: proline-rich protein 36 [Daucus carota subsp. sativus]WOG82864.1 hypothetical protein DCAR_0102033 [Daucus carota subsp. sativus]
MSTEVEQAPRVDHGIQTNITSTSSAAPTISPKISKFAAKSGFVIPKNKLSGSLVPAYRGSKKLEGTGPISEESSKQTQRKTKWGPDLTQDAAVRKGLAAAYQTRVDQITKQLNSGIVDIEEDLSAASQTSGQESSRHNEKSELLELERREAIGEILKLNPSYKAPAYYKPLLREARVPVPVKDYPGFNFISLIYGPGSDTQKRLEKETGAKIRVFGTKSDKGKKEVTADESDNQNLYEELYVHVSADTYEKVDAAVALIELLVTPVSVNPTVNPTSATAVSSVNVNAVQTSQGSPVPYVITPQVSQGVVQSVTGPALVQPFGQFQAYPGPWFPTSSPLGFATQQNLSAQIPSSHVQMSSASLNSNMSSFFGPRPAEFSSVQGPSFVPSRPQPLLQQPYMPQAPNLGYNSHPRNPPMPTLHPTPGQSNISAPPFTGNTPPLRPSQVVGPLVPPSAGPPTFSVHSANPAGRANAWLQAPAGPNTVGPQRPPISLQSTSPFNVTNSNMVSTMNTTFQPTPSQPSLLPTSGPSPAPAMTRAMLPGVLANPVMAAAPISLSMPSTLIPPPHPQSGVQISGSATSPATTPKPLHPSSNDFTFQPNRPQNPASQMPLRPNIQYAHNGMPPRNLNIHPPQAHQMSSFHPPVQNSAPPPIMQGFPRPQVSNDIHQPRVHMSSPRNPAFPSAWPVSPPSSTPQMGMRNFSPSSQMMNAGGAFQFRPGNIQPPQNYPTRPQGVFIPNQQFNGNLAFPPNRPSTNSFGRQQNYDPFSPTSVPPRPPLSVNPLQPRSEENDPEYEDLMASVGVK